MKRSSSVKQEIKDIERQAEEMGLSEARHIREEFPQMNSLRKLRARINLLLEKSIPEKHEQLKNLKKFQKILVETIVGGKKKDAPFIMSLTGDARKEIREMLCGWIYSLQYGWKQYTNLFHNVILMGGAGVGKTMVAKVIAHVLTNIGVTVTNTVKIVSKSDLVSQWVGETSRLMQAQLIQAWTVCFLLMKRMNWH